MGDDAKLTIKIENKHPLELLDLTRSFFGFADEFKRHLDQVEECRERDNVRLYIKEIKTGSVVADLVAFSASALPLVTYANTFLSFCGNMRTAYDFLLGKSSERPSLSKQNLENLSNFIEPVAKDNGSQINVSVTINGDVKNSFQFNSVEANAIQNTARREIQAMTEPAAGLKEQVLLYWYQARNDIKSQVGDKAIIESICRKPVKAIFVNDRLKAKMLFEAENPFTFGYVVDVVVDTIEGRPALYKILAVHEKVEKTPKEDSSQPELLD